MTSSKQSLCIAIIGMGGGVATTAAVGIELLKQGKMNYDGLPLRAMGLDDGLIPYESIHFTGWDINPATAYEAAHHHAVLPRDQIEEAKAGLQAIKPRNAVGDIRFCKNIEGDNVVKQGTKFDYAQSIIRDIQALQKEHQRMVVINLVSTERTPDLSSPALQSLAAFEEGLKKDDDAISPTMIYAYATIKCGAPYGNFTPNVGPEIPALLELAEQTGSPVAGRDGKTGQTFMKTVLAPALRARGLKINGWYSTNILGNRDGQALADSDSLASKIGTKGDVLNDMLGYVVKDHIVQINYYPPRGDQKEAWDNIDFTGFLGQPMQIKVDFLCRDSILAAPLVIEIARCLDLAKQRGESGPVDALGCFFKAPMVKQGTNRPEHAFFVQQQNLVDWLNKSSNSKVIPLEIKDVA